MKERHAVVKDMAKRYRRAGRRERGRLLDDVMRLTGYTRAYTALLLRGYAKGTVYGPKGVLLKRSVKRTRNRVPVYGTGVHAALKKIWTPRGLPTSPTVPHVGRLALPCGDHGPCFPADHRVVNAAHGPLRSGYPGASVCCVAQTPEHEVIIHSDQGSQSASDDWIRFCDEHNLVRSMSRRGNAYDNVAMESFFASLKKERVRRRTYRAIAEARADVFDHIEMFYNRKRRHDHLGGISPVEFERKKLVA